MEDENLYEALLDAFPDKHTLEKMVRFQLEQNLEAIAGGDNNSERIFKLITWVRAKGKLTELIMGAYKDNPDNPKLKAFYENYQNHSIISIIIPSDEIKIIEKSNHVSLEEPEGQVPLESAFYIERFPIEIDCFETILKPGALIRIKAPRQMGKTSLMSRIINQATQKGYKTVVLNFQTADAEFLSSLDQFLQWFCASIAYEINLPDNLSENWKGVLGSKNKCTNYFQRYVLPEINKPLILGLDEVDEIFKHPQIANDFFGLLRAWHERSKNEPIWKNLRLVIVHSQEVYIPLNINHSPFNVGLPIELPEFNYAQVEDLTQRHGLNQSDIKITELMNLVGGHPYLVRVALYQIARGRMTLPKLQEIAPTASEPYSDHLRRHLLNLQQDAELIAALKRVMRANEPVDIGTTEAFKLRSMGLVKFHGNQVIPLCNLYRQYFLNRLEVKS